MITEDLIFMQEALKEAQLAFDADEIPIGAIAVKDGEIIARGHNAVEELHSVTAHAEFQVLKQLESQFNDWRMTGITLYVTKEPCLMCAGMLVNARFSRVVFGLEDPNSGGTGGAVNLLTMPKTLWHPEFTGGIMAKESLELIQRFFKRTRLRNNTIK